MGGLKTITQDTFDAAVQENIQEFDMEAEEAVRSAVEEFKLQGVDLSSIVQTAGGAADAAAHPAVQAVEQLQAACSSAAQQGAEPDAITLQKALRRLAEAVSCSDKAAQSQALALAEGREATKAVLRCLPPSAQGGVVAAGLAALKALLAEDAARAAFQRWSGATILTNIAAEHPDDAAVWEAAARVAERAAFKHEGNKCGLVDATFGTRLVAALGGPAGQQPRAVLAACAAIRRLTTADDSRPVTSRAFQNSRMLAKAGAMTVLLGSLRSAAAANSGRVPGDLAAGVCDALKKLAANEEVCQEFHEAGGTTVVLQVLRSHLADADAARAAASALRQLANSDAIKAAVIEAGGLELLVQAASAHPDSAPLLEQALGLLANLMLRNPEGADAAAAAGCADAACEVLAGLGSAAESERPGAQWVARQACMALRNMVVRNLELRPLVLEKGAEALLRAARARHPSTCDDVGAAALRDLGFDDYNS